MNAVRIILLLLSLLALCGAQAPVFGMAASADAEDVVRARAQQEIAARFPHEAHRLDVRVQRMGGTLDPDAGFDLVFPTLDEVPRAHLRVELQQGEGRAWALLYVAHFDSVVVLNRTVSANEELQAADVAAAWMETTAFHGEPLRLRDWQRVQADGPVFAARRATEGRALRQGDVRGPFAADLGASVTMHYRRGPVVLHLTAEARQRGGIGDVIRLYAKATNTTYLARLIAIGEAEWVSTL